MDGNEIFAQVIGQEDASKIDQAIRYLQLELGVETPPIGGTIETRQEIVNQLLWGVNQKRAYSKLNPLDVTLFNFVPITQKEPLAYGIEYFDCEDANGFWSVHVDSQCSIHNKCHHEHMSSPKVSSDTLQTVTFKILKDFKPPCCRNAAWVLPL
jgi:hypothetical protein